MRDFGEAIRKYYHYCSVSAAGGGGAAARQVRAATGDICVQVWSPFGNAFGKFAAAAARGTAATTQGQFGAEPLPQTRRPQSLDREALYTGENTWRCGAGILF